MHQFLPVIVFLFQHDIFIMSASEKLPKTKYKRFIFARFKLLGSLYGTDNQFQPSNCQRLLVFCSVLKCDKVSAIRNSFFLILQKRMLGFARPVTKIFLSVPVRLGGIVSRFRFPNNQPKKNKKYSVECENDAPKIFSRPPLYFQNAMRIF